MLIKSKSITVSGTSQTEDGKIIGYFNGNISGNGNVSISSTINDRELFEKNKDAYRVDRADFNEFVDGLVDQQGQNETGNPQN